MEKVSNHYVPQFYLRNFSADKKNVGLYVIKHKKYVQKVSIRRTACKDYLYGEDGKIEDMFMHIERQAARIIRGICESQSIPNKNSEDYHTLLIFILLCEARNIKAADSFNNLINVQMKTILKMKMDHGQLPDISPEFLEDAKISADIPNLLSIQTTANIYPILLDLKTCLIVNKTDRNFLTSDNPLVRYNLMYIKRGYRLRGYGFGNMGIQLFFPITPRLCICVFDDILYKLEGIVEKDNIIITKGKYVDELNKLFYLNSYESIFFNDKSSESYIKRIVESNVHSNSEIEKETTVLGSPDNKLIIHSKRKVDEKIILAMFNINRNFVNMPLPSHMAGPFRPYAQNFIDSQQKEKRIKKSGISKGET